MRSGVRAVFRFFFFLCLCFAFGIALGGALCFGLYLGFRRGIWEVLCVLDCIWDFGVGFGRCFVYCGFGRVDLGGGLRNGVKAFG